MKFKMEYDFSGWATRNNLKCSDGRTIMKDAFKENDGQTVPLVWNHQHNDPYNVLGHALLENRDEGVYAYCSLNDTEQGKMTKTMIEHGDVKALSIYANKLKQNGGNVIHGAIREVSVVLAGANPGAFIDTIIQHNDDVDEEAIIYNGEDLQLSHSDDEAPEDIPEEDPKEEIVEHADNKEDKSMANEKTVGDVLGEFTDEQKEVVAYLIGQALSNGSNDSEGGNDGMKHNIFDNEEQGDVLTHADMQEIISDAKRYGSMKEAFLAHSTEIEYAPRTQDYGIYNPEFLFPEAKALNNPPEFIRRDTGWVSTVMGGVSHTPFSRIKSVFADITEDDARAKGYIKGKYKKEEVFGLLKRTTTPCTVYKKQKMDRDDTIDITDFDVIAWLKAEMRGMLDEELARAILVGDGRSTSSDDKINEQCIRPIWKDEDLFTIKRTIEVASSATTDDICREFIRANLKARKDYKGSGNLTLFTTEDLLTDMLLMEDKMGRPLYETEDKLRSALRVSRIVTVPVLEGLTRTESSDTLNLMGIFVNLKDYNVGADKGGAVNMFDDFDIDYNAMKYLIETRCSGALTKPYSAIVIESKQTA